MTLFPRRLLASLLLPLALPLTALAQPKPVPEPPDTAASAAAAPLSASARRLFDASRAQLVQVRTLLAQQDSQSSVGSGFVVSEDGLIVSNYHVVSQAALEPAGYRLRFVGADGRRGSLQLLAIDVRHDLSLLRAVDEAGKPLRFARALAFRPATEPLDKGDRIYSMGHPQDVAFAIVEGNYNGLVERRFDPLIYYAGSLNPGMSGGPVLDEQGRVVGVNVSMLLFSQQMSFLIPGGFAEALVQRAKDAKPIQGPVWPLLREQLLAYGEELTQRFTAQPWRPWGGGQGEEGKGPRWRIPIPQEQFLRCWGSSTPPDAKGMRFQRMQCRMDHALFLSGRLHTGYLDVQHEIYDGSRLGAWRFARQYSASFKNENLGRSNDKDRTAPHCTESFVDAQGLPARAVVCLRAHRKMDGIHDVTVLLTAVDQPTEGLLGRFDAHGVGFEQAMKLARHFLAGYGKPGAAR
ncbi:serine protease [Inhella sp.]|uniref:S1 family peptidase n=1 Tax=Inhella sp. TaxID=1921806 RepID=UPI0035B3CFD7